MKEFDYLFDENEIYEFLFEMANIPTQKSGLKYCIYFSNNEHSTGPRIKIFNSTRCGVGVNISMTISSKPRITKDTIKNLKYFDKKEIKKIAEMVVTFKNELLLFWYNSDCFVNDSSDLKASIITWFQTGRKRDIELFDECNYQRKLFDII